MKDNPIAIALSARWYTFPQRFQWIAEHDFELEYTPGPEALDELPRHVGVLLERGRLVRFHGFFPGYELGDPDAGLAD
ncbi:MAG: hypothetical protein JW820_18240, partial [Spirochaetales bacterium]|nr:hypothetical protein [Spirochaetales bacterium]